MWWLESSRGLSTEDFILKKLTTQDATPVAVKDYPLRLGNFLI